MLLKVCVGIVRLRTQRAVELHLVFGERTTNVAAVRLKHVAVDFVLQEVNTIGASRELDPQSLTCNNAFCVPYHLSQSLQWKSPRFFPSSNFFEGRSWLVPGVDVAGDA